MRIGRARIRWLLLVAVTIGACRPSRGCVEASFTLAPDSPRPKWFASKGIARAEVSVTMDYWVGPVGRTATFTLANAKGRNLASAVGQLQGRTPLTLEPPGTTGPLGYPRYEIITVEGITEAIEHRRMEPIFHVNNDPGVRQKLGVSARSILR